MRVKTTYTRVNAGELQVRPGDYIQVDLRGVPEWKIPATRRTATVRDPEHAALIQADAAESIEYGNATVTVTTEREDN